jgi:hypothetical protein
LERQQMTFFDLGSDATDRSRFAVFGHVLRSAQFLTVADPRRDPLLATPLLIVLGDQLAEGAIFFSLSSDEGRGVPASAGWPERAPLDMTPGRGWQEPKPRADRTAGSNVWSTAR